MAQNQITTPANRRTYCATTSAHRIGQIRDVHIYRFISQHTVEEAMLRKANQKRHLDDLVIQKGEFDWRTLFGSTEDARAEDLTRALEDFADTEDAHAARVAAREAGELEGADKADFGEDAAMARRVSIEDVLATPVEEQVQGKEAEQENVAVDVDVVEEEGGTTVDYMLSFVRYDYEHFRDWRL